MRVARTGWVASTRRRSSTILIAAAMWGAGCSDEAPNLTGPAEPDVAIILSDTAVSAVFAASSVPGVNEGQSGSSSTTAGANDANVAYVSLPPGTVPRGVSATLRIPSAPSLPSRRRWTCGAAHRSRIWPTLPASRA